MERFYRGVLADELQTLRHGGAPRVRNPVFGVQLRADDERAARNQALRGLLYDQLQQAAERPELLRDLVRRAIDPILTEATTFLATETLSGGGRGAGGAAAERLRFQAEWRPEARFGPKEFKYTQLFRPLLLVSAINEHPWLIDSVDESSANFPERLFRSPPRRPDYKAWDQRYAGWLLEATPERVADFAARLAKHVAPLTAETRPSERMVRDAYRLDRFALPNGCRFQWSVEDPATAVTEMESATRAFELKRELLEHLVSAMWGRGKLLSDRPTVSQLQSPSSVFATTPVQYKSALTTAENFAVNQVIRAFNTTSKIPDSRLMNMLGVTADTDGTNLKVHFARGGTLTFPNAAEARYRDSSTYLPLCGALLTSWLAAARTITAAPANASEAAAAD